MKYIIITLALIACGQPNKTQDKPNYYDTIKIYTPMNQTGIDTARYYIVVYDYGNGIGNFGWKQGEGNLKMKELVEFAIKRAKVKNVVIVNIIELKNKSEFDDMWEGYR